MAHPIPADLRSGEDSSPERRPCWTCSSGYRTSALSPRARNRYPCSATSGSPTNWEVRNTPGRAASARCSHSASRRFGRSGRSVRRGSVLTAVGGGEKGYQFSGREGARCGVTLWPAVGRRKREEADCFLSQAGLSSLLTSGVR
jgi:hypothetical protein